MADTQQHDGSEDQGVPDENQLMDELRRLEQSARTYQQEVSHHPA